MTLEAARNTAAAAWAPVPALMLQGACALEQIAAAVERQVPPQSISPRLRASQRELARELGGTSAASAIATELVTLTDRLVDNINTLGHIVARAQAVRPQG